MTKAELLKNWHESALTDTRSIAHTDVLLDSLCNVIAAELLGGGEIPLPGVGKLKVKATPARAGRNPKTGEAIDIPAGRKVVFVSGKELKEALKG